jgi:hypothetical protein
VCRIELRCTAIESVQENSRLRMHTDLCPEFSRIAQGSTIAQKIDMLNIMDNILVTITQFIARTRFHHVQPS